MARRLLFALCCGLASVSATQFAPNHFLGTCLNDDWVQSVETTQKVSSTARDAQGRLEHPHLHAALPSRRFAINDPRINGRRMDKLYSTACTATPFKFWGVNAQVDPSTGTLTDIGTANGSLVVEYKGWMSSQLTTLVFLILAQEVLGYNVSLYKSTNAADMGARMSSALEGLCTPIHINLEEWGRDHSAYANETYKAGIQSYVGRSGLYTTTKFLNQGIDPAQYSPTFSADFWRDYATNEKLIGALNVDVFLNNTDYYPPKKVICADGFRGCKNSCSKTDTCTDREAKGGKCLALIMMYPTYDDGWAESCMANNKVASYHCFIGADAIEAYAVEMEAKGVPIFFFHYEPDPFHLVHHNKFARVFLPRALPELVKLNQANFGENGYGKKTNNPLSVDFQSTTLNLYGSSLLQDYPPIATLLSRYTLTEIHMNDLLKLYVDITSNGATAIEPDDPVFSSACSWVRDNYSVWRRWLDRLPLCSAEHINFTFLHCSDGQPREITWAWKDPHPLDATKPYVCDGGMTELPAVIRTSKSCDWLKANLFVWWGWTYASPACDAQFYSFRVSACNSNAQRMAEYYWLLPDPADASKSLECTGGAQLPATVEIPCEFTPHSAPLFRVILALAAVLAVLLLGMIGFVVKFRKEPIIKRSQFEFLAVMIIGGIMMCGAAVVYAGEPTRFLCAARPVVTSLGFTLIFGSLVVKSMRVYRVFMSGAMKRVVLSTLTMFKILGVFVLVDIVILVAWFAVDFPAPYLKATAVGALGGATIDHHVCMSSSFIFTALLIFWKAIVLFMGLYLSFLIRNVSTDFQESIWIFGSALVVLFGSIVILPMAYLVDLPATVFFAFLGFMLLGCTALVMSMMLVPKIRRLHEKSHESTTRETNEGDSASEDTKTTKVSKIRFGSKAAVQITPVQEFRPKTKGKQDSSDSD